MKQNNVCSLSLAFILLAGCTNRGNHVEKPLIRLHLDQLNSEVQAQSRYSFSKEFLDCSAGGELVTFPHTLVYHDDVLTLRVEEAGGLETLPTSIGCSIRMTSEAPDSRIENVIVFLLPNYVSLPAALKKARELKDDLLGQGFLINERTPESRFTGIFKNAPRKLDAFDDIENAFLDSAFFVQSATVFDMSKQTIRLELTLANARRKWGERGGNGHMEFLDTPETRAIKEANNMKTSELLSEPSYFLVLHVGPTDDWAKTRRKKLAGD